MPKPPPKRKVATLRTPDARVSALGIARDTARAIERGVYTPGARLREQELADKFQCSRAPVREALRILESQGIIVIEPMKGARIASIEDESFYEVYLIRRALAGLMAQECAKAKPSSDKTAFLNHARGLMREAETVADGHSFGVVVRKAIRLFATLAHTPRTVQIVRSLTFGHEAFQDGIVDTKKSRREQARLWARVADAVEAQDTDAARAAMEKIFDQAYDYVEANMGRAIARATE